MRDFLGLSFGGLLFFLVGSFLLREAYRAEDSVTWPVVDAQIQKSSVRLGGKNGSKYYPEVLYTFTLADQLHKGNKVSFDDNGSRDRSYAQSIVDRYPQGTVVSVHYYPADPSVCVIEPGLNSPAYHLVVLGPIFLLTGMFLLANIPVFKNIFKSWIHRRRARA